ncbi:MAG: hypothetical protein PHI29_04500 [Gallionella sp.]|nr:hypothetical protein [Gallionella sp.]
MEKLHLIVPDLLLPQRFAAEVTVDLALPCLQKIMARADHLVMPARSMEAALCDAFAVEAQHDLPIASITAAFDGLPAGCWMRADPVHLQLQRDQMLLSLPEVEVDEAVQFCAALNEYFVGQGMTFYAPHPQRWYVRVQQLPDMQTTPLSEVIGGNVRGALPQGADSQHWHQLFNEMQMLLYSHALNDVREARGALAVNSLWLWGGGESVKLQTPYASVRSDDSLSEMFCAAAGIAPLPLSVKELDADGEGLMVYSALRSAMQSADLHAWREALLRLESDIAAPIWQALRNGSLASLQLDILAGENSQRRVLTRGQTWRLWRPAKRLAAYSLV